MLLQIKLFLSLFGSLCVYLPPLIHQNLRSIVSVATFPPLIKYFLVVSKMVGGHQEIFMHINQTLEKPPTLIPQTLIKQLRAFLGLASYYRKFIRYFAIIATLLTDVLKQEGFKWSEQSQQAFFTLKMALTQASVLALPYFSKPFILETDSSATGICAILSQEHHPIA